jgi:acetyltransferase-like isoleucine patch superfamily enzyme
MKSRWIIGAGVCFEEVFGTWTRAFPQENVQRIELLPANDYTFDLGALDALDPGEGTMFVAFDERFGNFKRMDPMQAAMEHGFTLESFISPLAVLPPDLVRMELIQAAMERGFELESFISPSAIVPPDVIIGPNVFVGEGAVLGIGCRIDFNTVIRDGAKLGAGVHLHPSCWLETGVLVGDDADIGAHSILRIGAVVGSRVKIGNHCELGWARLYDKDVSAGTVFDTRYEEPIYVYGE